MERQRSFRVLVSSTYIDSKQRRAIVAEAIERAGMQPIKMERFAAGSQSPAEYSQEFVTTCHVFVGIIGHRYGSVPEGQSKSVSHLEYDAAGAAGITRLMFTIDASVPVVPDKDFDSGDTR